MLSDDEKQDLIGMDMDDAENIYSQISIIPIVIDGGLVTHALEHSDPDTYVSVEVQDNIITRILD